MRFLSPALPAALLLCAAQAAPTAAQVEQAATRITATLDGVLRDCPGSYAKVGTAEKRCVGAGQTVEQVRVKLSAALDDDLQGIWRSRDGQRSVYNWLMTPGGYVYLRLQADPDGRAQTLIYVDVPPEPAPAKPAASAAPVATVTITRPAAPTPEKPAAEKPATEKPPVEKSTPEKPAPQKPAASTPVPTPEKAAAGKPAAEPGPLNVNVRTLAPVPFTRTLTVQAARLNGADVLAVQNRLIALTQGRPGGRGDGWYGPVTAATVRAFQAANALPVTGQVDRLTWETLFTAVARSFAAPRLP